MELLQNDCNVVLYGLLAEREIGADLLVCLTLGDEVQYFRLAFSQ